MPVSLQPLPLLLVVLCLVCACAQQAKTAPKKHKTPGRHVCVENKVVTKPVKEMESYCKPIYKSQMHPCEKDKNKFCTSFRVVYERAFRTVYKITATKEDHHTCCPGWERHHPRAHGCNKPVCREPCANGGSCAKPDHCVCPVGWTGKSCNQDVNECKVDDHSVTAPAGNCSQRCLNTRGSYRCDCHEGFTLEPDGRSCRIMFSRIPEMQEFIQGYEELSKKIEELETSRRNMSELSRRLEELSQTVASLREEMLTSTPPPTTTTTTTTSTTTTTEPTTTSTTTTTTPPPTSSTSADVDESRYGSPWDRINSLSDQIAMLEERLDDCTCDPVDGTRHIPLPVK